MYNVYVWACKKILRKIMTFQKIAKTHFVQYLGYFSK